MKRYLRAFASIGLTVAVSMVPVMVMINANAPAARSAMIGAVMAGLWGWAFGVFFALSAANASLSPSPPMGGEG